jgi:hypothetical protein
VLITERANHPKVAANGASRLRKRIDTDASPYDGSWLEVLLDASREHQIIFEFLVTRTQLDIGRS